MLDTDAADQRAIIGFDRVYPKIEEVRAGGGRVGLCHGCFDIFHFGHLRHLTAASKVCDFLVVSVTSDRFVQKGPHRPVFLAEQRAEVLAGLSCVGDSIISDAPSANVVLTVLKPDVFIKGQDYEDDDNLSNQNFRAERDVAKELGIDVHFTHEERHSATEAIERLRRAARAG